MPSTDFGFRRAPEPSIAVVVGVVGEAYGIDGLLGLGSLGVAYGAALGAVALAMLWRVSASVAAGRDVLGPSMAPTLSRLADGW